MGTPTVMKPKNGRTYGFRKTKNGKTYWITTGKTKKAEAEEEALRLVENEAFMSEIFAGKDSASAMESVMENNPVGLGKNPSEVGSFFSYLVNDGWFSGDTNPKFHGAKMSNKHYSPVHSENLSSALRKMFQAVPDFKWFSSKPIVSITRADASKLQAEIFKMNPSKTKAERKSENEERKQVKQEGKIVQKQSSPIGAYKTNITALKTVFSYYYSQQVLEINPFARISIPKSEPNKSALSLVQWRRLLQVDTFRGIDYAPLQRVLENDYFRVLKFIGLTGCRPNEAYALTWGQIEQDKHIIHINRAIKSWKTFDISTPKWDKPRTIVVCDSVVELLGERKRDDELVFSKDGDFLTCDKMRRATTYLKTGAEKIGLKLPEDFTQYWLRGTLHTILAKPIETESDITELLAVYFGWSEKSNQTQVQRRHYTHFSVESLRTVAERIEKRFTGKEILWEEENGISQEDIDFEVEFQRRKLFG